MKFLALIICPRLMNSASNYFLPVLILLASAPCVCAEEEFSFDLEKFEKKMLQWKGYAELKWEHMDINHGSAFSLLNPSTSSSTLDRYTGSLQIDGRYDRGMSSINWLVKAAAWQDSIGWYDTTDVYEAYLSVKAPPSFTGTLGKKSYKWGKGYAWNPVGFINRPKDPNNPEEALEGYITTGADLIKSFTGSVQTAALTTVVLPVWEDVNDDFGVPDNINIAAKLYFLYKDTDIDLLFATGNSRSTRYGLDFSRNLASNFEIHGEAAFTPNHKKITLHNDGSLATNTQSTFSYLLGLRHLTENNITSIIEYYHNDGGYTAKEMGRFFQLVADGESQFLSSNVSILLDKAREISLKGYGKAQPGRNYLYGRFTHKEPFDILYCSPGITTIFNLDDRSYSLSPEMVYTGFTNWELRVRFSYLAGPSFSEFGEKLHSNKLELRVRFFF